ncbi:hypothetical protein Mapa_000937 [Marchantia paleacea]|nr:hypothetical protein Mapa_000937 [Marchantia paleacea]
MFQKYVQRRKVLKILKTWPRFSTTWSNCKTSFRETAYNSKAKLILISSTQHIPSSGLWSIHVSKRTWNPRGRSYPGTG